MSHGATAGRSCAFSAPALMEDSGRLQNSRIMTKKTLRYMKCSMKGGEMWDYSNHALCVDIFFEKLCL
jgi:hypothetical protein